MEQWSILSNILNYIQYDRHPKTYHGLSINAVNKYKINAKEKRDIIELDFGTMSEVLKEEYLDVYCIIMMSSILSVFILYLYLYLFVSSVSDVLFISNSMW